LEDRIVRIRSGRSPASVPLRRTTHVVGNFLLAGAEGKSLIRMRSSWTSHVFDSHHKRTDVFFGHAYYELRRKGKSWLIAKKKTILQNDYLPSMVDIYCI
jgi:3-phenylpropionate/cinnamic acid dioxygenase small subunit